MLTADDLAEEDLADDDLTDEDAGLFTEEMADLVLPVRLLRLEDLVVDPDMDDLVDPEPTLDRVIEELLTPALLDEEPIPPLLLEPVVLRREV